MQQAKHILALSAMLATCASALGQIRLGERERGHLLSLDTVYESYVQTPVPLPVGPMYYLKAWPILERKKARPRDFPIWAKYDETHMMKLKSIYRIALSSSSTPVRVTLSILHGTRISTRQKMTGTTSTTSILL